MEDLAQNELNTLLLQACKNNDVELARTYLDLGASLNYFQANSNFRLSTEAPMAIATREKHLEVMQLLLERGANPNEVHLGNTLLHIAVYHRFKEGVHLLLKFGADPAKRNTETNWSVVHIAISHEDEEMLKIVRPNQVESEILWDVVNYGDLSKIRFLLANRIDLNGVNFWGYSILDLVCRRKNYTILKLLLAHGVDPCRRRDQYCITPLHILCSYDDHPEIRLNMATELIKYRADVNSLWIMKQSGGTIQYNSPLHVAIEAGFYPMIKLLVISGATLTDNLQVDSQGKNIITKGIELSAWNKPEVVLALQRSWTPSTHYLFPSEIRRSIMCLFLLRRAQEWPFDKSIMQRICTFIVEYYYSPAKPSKKRPRA